MQNTNLGWEGSLPTSVTINTAHVRNILFDVPGMPQQLTSHSSPKYHTHDLTLRGKIKDFQKLAPVGRRVMTVRFVYQYNY